MSLDLFVASIKGVTRAFDNDFDSFRVFLEVFVPQAFERVFFGESAGVECSVQIPTTYQEAFAAPVSVETPALPTQALAAARERAEWLWRLANGSLLVPFLLALAVMYYGVAISRDAARTQYEALKPILEHQLKLLEEDRRRLLRDTSGGASPPMSGASSSTK